MLAEDIIPTATDMRHKNRVAFWDEFKIRHIW